MSSVTTSRAPRGRRFHRRVRPRGLGARALGLRAAGGGRGGPVADGHRRRVVEATLRSEGVKWRKRRVDFSRFLFCSVEDGHRPPVQS